MAVSNVDNYLLIFHAYKYNMNIIFKFDTCKRGLIFVFATCLHICLKDKNISFLQP